MSIRLIIRMVWVVWACGFGYGCACPGVPVWVVVVPSQNPLIMACMWALLLAFIALKASAGVLFAPGDSLFFRSRIANLIFLWEIGLSSSCVYSCWWTWVKAFGEMLLLWLINNFSQCGCITDMFSLLFFAFEPFGRHSNMVWTVVWVAEFPREVSLTAFQFSFEFSPISVPIFLAMCLMQLHFASLTAVLRSFVTSFRLIGFGGGWGPLVSVYCLEG